MARATLQTVSTIFFLLLQFIFFEVSSAGSFCGSYSTYCRYGCCGRWNQECCYTTAAIIYGPVLGGGAFIFILILVCCICRRRRNNGTVMYGQAGPTVINASTVTRNNGVVTTSGVQPGYLYPPQPVAHYGQTFLPYGQPVPYTNHSAPPPSYENVAAAPSAMPQPGGGNVNSGFEPK